jgi:hypothetical protein
MSSFPPSAPSRPLLRIRRHKYRLIISSQYEFLRQLSTNPANIVVGLVRNKSNTDKKVAEDGLKNVTILEADILDLPALQVCTSS